MRCSSQPFLSATKPNLHTQHIPYRLRSFLLRCGGDMSVGVQREASGEVTEHSADGLNVYTVLEGNGCEGVPLRYNYDKPEKPFNTNGF